MNPLPAETPRFPRPPPPPMRVQHSTHQAPKSPTKTKPPPRVVLKPAAAKEKAPAAAKEKAPAAGEELVTIKEQTLYLAFTQVRLKELKNNAELNGCVGVVLPGSLLEGRKFPGAVTVRLELNRDVAVSPLCVEMVKPDDVITADERQHLHDISAQMRKQLVREAKSLARPGPKAAQAGAAEPPKKAAPPTLGGPPKRAAPPPPASASSNPPAAKPSVNSKPPSKKLKTERVAS